MVSSKKTQQHLLRILVGDIAYHDGRPSVRNGFFWVDYEHGGLFSANCLAIAGARFSGRVMFVVVDLGRLH
jgi:hypothetical protein